MSPTYHWFEAIADQLGKINIKMFQKQLLSWLLYQYKLKKKDNLFFFRQPLFNHSGLGESHLIYRRGMTSSGDARAFLKKTLFKQNASFLFF